MLGREEKEQSEYHLLRGGGHGGRNVFWSSTGVDGSNGGGIISNAFHRRSTDLSPCLGEPSCTELTVDSHGVTVALRAAVYCLELAGRSVCG
jgi:hypothetical protein